jgi:hypothetical protein
VLCALVDFLVIALLFLDIWIKDGGPDMTKLRLEQRLFELSISARVIRLHVFSRCREFLLPTVTQPCASLLGSCKNPQSTCTSISNFFICSLLPLSANESFVTKNVVSCDCNQLDELASSRPRSLCVDSTALQLTRCPALEFQPQRVLALLNLLIGAVDVDKADNPPKSIKAISDFLEAKCQQESIHSVYAEDRDDFPPLTSLESTLECY